MKTLGLWPLLRFYSNGSQSTVDQALGGQAIGVGSTFFIPAMKIHFLSLFPLLPLSPYSLSLPSTYPRPPAPLSSGKTPGSVGLAHSKLSGTVP